MRSGEWIFASGQIPLDPATGKLVPGEIEDQTRRVLENLSAVLVADGSSLERVVRTTVYLTDLSLFPRMNAVYAEFFTAAPDGIDMQAGDAGDVAVAAVADFLGLQAGDPAALLLIEALQQSIQLAMELPLGMVRTSSTAGTLALMDRRIVHNEFSVDGRCADDVSLRRSWKFEETGNNF